MLTFRSFVSFFLLLLLLHLPAIHKPLTPIIRLR
jgi:hypothetical protein